MALGGAGFPLGSLIARRLADRVGIGPSLILAGVPSVLGLTIGASSSGHLSLSLLAVGTFINGVGQGVFTVNALTMRHLATPPDMTTRATAVHRTVTWGVLPIGAYAPPCSPHDLGRGISAIGGSWRPGNSSATAPAPATPRTSSPQ